MTAATLIDAWEDAWRRWPERVALTAGSARLTFAELQGAVDATKCVLREAGVGRGDRVICQLPNSVDHVVVMGATWSCGGVHVGADHDLTATEVAWLAGHTGATAVVCATGADGHGQAVARLLATEHPDTRVLEVCTTAAGGSLTSVGSPATPPASDGDGPPPSPAEAAGPDDPAVIFFTSGTTGTPKGPIGTHGDLAEGWGWIAEDLALTADDVHLAQLPLAHGFGMSLAWMALARGGQLVLMERFSADAALDLVTSQRVTVLNGTPTHFVLLTDRFDAARHDASSLRVGVGSAAHFAPHLLRRIFDILDMDLMLMYGSSEGVGVVTMDRAEMLAGSVGRPEPGHVAIVGSDRRQLPAGEVGEIAFCRAGVEYWRPSEAGGVCAGAADPALTDEGWYFSGDVGRLDDDGRLYVLGRRKHQVNRGGMKVDPGEVEHALVRVPGVADAAVIGIPDPVLGERVCACVVADGDGPPALDGLRACLGEVLAPHKLPEALRVVESLPRTSIGKVDRAALLAQVEGAAGLRPR